MNASGARAERNAGCPEKCLREIFFGKLSSVYLPFCSSIRDQELQDISETPAYIRLGLQGIFLRGRAPYASHSAKTAQCHLPPQSIKRFGKKRTLSRCSNQWLHAVGSERDLLNHSRSFAADLTVECIFRPRPTKAARWQNLIPSCALCTPPLVQSKERKGSNFAV